MEALAMYKVLDVNLLRIPGSLRELAPLAKKHGLDGISVPKEILMDPGKAEDAAAIVRDHGLSWGLLHTPVDFFTDGVEGTALEEALQTQEQWASIGEKLGVHYAYNHIWPSHARRAFAENFDWHVERLTRVQAVFERHGVQYGLEFLGPYELRTLRHHPFVHTIAGVLAIADAAGGKAGFLFDVYHWYTGSRRPDDLYFAAQNCRRMVNLHLNDGVTGKAPDEQLDLTRGMPMTAGVIDSAMIYSVFKVCGYAGPVMCEPMRPTTDLYATLPAEQSIAMVAEAFRRVEFSISGG
jgi:sugar phosphate isomerase/epimerase